MIENHLSDALQVKFKEEEFQDCYLVDIEVGKNDKIAVFVDSDTHLTLGRCARLSRYLEHLIEENGWLGEKYTLEVSSPGVGRPLKLRRQYHKNIGRKVRIKHVDGNKIDGQLLAVDDNGIKVELEKGQVKEIAHDEIKSCKIRISFK